MQAPLPASRITLLTFNFYRCCRNVSRPVRSVRPARPGDFHTAIYFLSKTAPNGFALQPRWDYSFLVKNKLSQRRKGERIQHSSGIHHEPPGSCSLTRQARAWRRRGERMSLYTYRFAISLKFTATRLYSRWAVAQRRRGERMSLYTYRFAASLNLQRPACIHARLVPGEEGERE
jgi:hypothetical protein